MSSPQGKRDELFNNNRDSNGLYSGWSDELLNKVTVTTRTVFYDSNVAFTNGDSTITGTENTHTVPNLYATLAGLNSRINDVMPTTSTADAYLCVTPTTDDNDTQICTIQPGDGSPGVGGRPASNTPSDTMTTLNLSAEQITFTVGDSTYSMLDIFNMIKELDARTAMLKTNISKNERTLDIKDINGTNNTQPFALDHNIINGNN